MSTIILPPNVRRALRFTDEKETETIVINPGHGNSREWSVNGWPALIVLWTPQEWANIQKQTQPKDTTAYPCGTHIAFRMK